MSEDNRKPTAAVESTDLVAYIVSTSDYGGDWTLRGIFLTKEAAYEAKWELDEHLPTQQNWDSDRAEIEEVKAWATAKAWADANKEATVEVTHGTQTGDKNL